MLEGVDAAQIALVIQWGSDRRICQNSTAAAQAVKTVEEANELLEAASNNDFSEYRDAVGDILVTLILGLKIANDRNGSSFPVTITTTIPL